MNEIICPHCKKTFKVDETGFADILKQVRDHQFDEEIRNRLSLAEKEKESAVKLAEANIKIVLQDQLAKKDQEFTDFKARNEIELVQKLSHKENELGELKAKIENAELVKTLAVTDATKIIEKERDELANSLKSKEAEKIYLKKH